jgi:hypothetical protein
MACRIDVHGVNEIEEWNDRANEANSGQNQEGATRFVVLRDNGAVIEFLLESSLVADQWSVTAIPDIIDESDDVLQPKGEKSWGEVYSGPENQLSVLFFSLE